MLKKRVSEIAIMNVDRIPHDRAGFGSTVHVVESNGEKQVFQLVMPEDADAAKGLISTTSPLGRALDRKSTRLNSSHTVISYAVFCLKKKKKKKKRSSTRKRAK